MSARVAVVIPVYDRPRRVLEAIDSVLHQTLKEFELVVVDDGSKESHAQPRAVVESHGHKFIRTQNQGCSAARNLGVELTRAPWIAFLDSDDTWLPEKLERQLQALEAGSHRYGQVEEVWIRNGRRVNPGRRHRMSAGDIFERSCAAVCVSNSSVMVERRFFEELGRFKTRYRVCEDYELWLRAAARESIHLLEERLTVKYGGHPDQLSRKYPAMDRFRLVALLEMLLDEDLSPTQREIALQEARRKTRILITGAEKRGHDSLETWNKVSSHLGSSLDLRAATQAARGQFATKM